VGTPILRDLVDRETGAFENVNNKWRPQNLFFELQTKELMSDMVRRHSRLKEAENELQTLDRSERLLKLVRMMGLVVKRAHFVRRSNHLAFGQMVSEFYTAYGEVLRYLKIDVARGKLEPA
jgi:hypothetical protein